MQKIQESKIKMSRAVSGILNGYAELVNRTPGLTVAHRMLDNLIGETEQHNQDQLNNGKELTTGKKEARNLLTLGTISIRSALAALGTSSDDPQLKLLKVKYQAADSEVKRMRDMQLSTYAYTVYNDALPYATQMNPFATADDVAQLKVLADNFNSSLPQKRTQQSKSKLSTQNLEDVVAQIDLLLNDTIDVLVKPWENKEPNFYKAYQNARMLVDAASRKTKIDETPQP